MMRRHGSTLARFALRLSYAMTNALQSLSDPETSFRLRFLWQARAILSSMVRSRFGYLIFRQLERTVTPETTP